MVGAWLRELFALKSRDSQRTHRLTDQPRWKRVRLFAEALEDRLVPSSSPVAIQQLYATPSSATSSTSFSVVPGLSTTVSLASAQTVDISSIVGVYKSYSDSNTDGLGADILVDSSAVFSYPRLATLMPFSGYNVDVSLSMHDAVNLSAGNHTIAVEWLSSNGNTLDVNGASTLIITAYNPLPGAAAPVATQQFYAGSGTTASSSYSVVPNFSTTVSLATAQTVDISSSLDVYNPFANNLNYVGAAIFVDGSQAANTQYTALDSSATAAEATLPLNDVINLSAGNHTIAVKWLSANGNTLDVSPASSLTITSYNPLPGGAAPVTTQQIAATSGSTSSSSYSVVPGLSTTVSLASAQTVDISSLLNVYNTGGQNYLIAGIFVDGSVLPNTQEIFLPTYGTTSSKGDFAVPLHDVLSLSAGNHTIQVEWASDYSYTIGLSTIAGGLPSSSSLSVITYNPVVPTVAYVNPSWASDSQYQTITDADPVTSGNQSAVYGVDAFSSVNSAIAAVAAGGAIYVNSGTYNEAVNLTNGDTMKLLGTGPTTAGTATIGSLAGASGTTVDTGTIGGLDNILQEGSLGTSTAFAGVISGPGSLAVQGGTLTVSGTNTYTGGTQITGGTLSISGDSNLGGVPGSPTTNIVINGGTLQGASSFTLNSNRGIALGPTSGSGTGTIDVTSGNTLTYGGILANNGGTGNFTKTDSGTLVLSGANTYSGATVDSQGTVKLQSTAPSGLVSSWTAEGNVDDSVGSNNGTLNNGATFAAGKVGQAFSFPGTSSYAQAPSNGLPTGNANRTLGLWVNILSFVSGTDALFAGYGQFGSLNDTYEIGAIANTGQLFFSQYGQAIIGPALQTGTWYYVTVANVGNAITLYMNGTAVGTGTFPLSTPTGTSFFMGGTNGANGFSTNFNGLVDGVQVYSSALSQTQIQTVMNQTASSILPTTTALQVASGATLDLNGNDAFTGAFTGAGTVTNSAAGGNATLTVNGTSTFGGVIQNGGTASVALSITGGTVTLTGASTYTGPTSISAGTLQIGNAGATGSLGTGNVTDNGSLVFDLTSGPTVANAISGTGSLTQEGSATLVLTGNNTISGLTTINSGGTLQIGTGGTTGTLGTGSVTDNGTLFIDQSSSINVTNAISGSGTLTLTSTAGAITQSTAITVATLVANASTGITLTTAGNAVSSFTAANSSSGNISLTNAAALTVGGISQAGTGTIAVANTGALTLSAPVSSSGNGAISLTASGSDVALNVNANVGGTYAPVTIYATGDLVVGTGVTINSGAAALTLGADMTAGGVGDNGIGTLTINSGATVTSTNTGASGITLRGADMDIQSGSSVFSVGLSGVSTFLPGYAQTNNYITGLSGPEFDAVDSSGNLYVVNTNTNTVAKYSSSGTTISASFITGLNNPRGLAIDSAGNFYVSNGNGTVGKYSSTGATINPALIGGLSNPWGLALDSSGNIYVANNSNTVAKYSSTGAAINASFITGLAAPYGLTFDSSGNLYVANYGSNAVGKYSSTGATLNSSFLSSGNGPVDVAIDAAGNFYVTYINSSYVSKFSSTGALISVGFIGGSNPWGLAIDSSANLYLVNNYNGTVTKAGLSLLTNPNFETFDSSGNLYVANDGSNTVSKVTPQGTVSTFISSGLTNPLGLAFDSSGNLYVANDGSTTISKYSSTGALISSSFITGLSSPVGVAFDSAGNIYVSNAGNNTVGKYSSTGAVINATYITGLSGARSLAFDLSGNLYIANINNGTVSKYNSSGNLLNPAYAFIPGNIYGLAFDTQGNLYVSNANTTVFEISFAGIVTTLTSGFSGAAGLAFDSQGNLYVANASNSAMSKLSFAGTVVVKSSVTSRPMSLGGANNAVAGINLTDAELGRIITGSQGSIVFGDSSQTGNITFTTATPATTAGASVVVQQSTSGGGQTVLDDDSAGSPGVALNGNGGSISLTAGTGGIVAANATNTIAEIATTGTVTLDTTGTIGSGTNPILFDGTAAPSSVVIGDADQPGGGVFLNGLGALTLGAITTTNAGLNVTAAGALTANGAIVTGGGNVSLNSVTSAFTNSAAGTINAGSGSVTVTADTIPAFGATITANGGITLQPNTAGRTIGLNDPAGAFNLTAAELGQLSSTGTVTLGAGVGGAVTIGGSGALSLAGGGYNLTIEGGATTLSNTLTGPSGQTLTLATGAVTNNGGSVVIGGNGTLALDTSGSVGSSATPLTTAVANLGTGTVTGNVFLSNNGSLTTTGPVSATGSINITMSNGNLTTNNGNFSAASTSLVFTSGSSQSLTTNGQAITNLTHSGAGVLTVASNLTLSGNFTDQSGAGNVDITNRTVNIAGNWSWGNSGSLVSTFSTVNFNGAGQSIGGNTTFYNLTKTTTVPATLIFQAASTQNVNGVLILDGAAGNLLSLLSSIPATQWDLNPLGYRSVSFVNVQDSFNINAYPLTASTSTDSGDNTNWIISPTNTTTTVATSSSPSVAGQMIAFTATVTAAGSGPAPSGIVSFFDGSTLIGTSTVSGGYATLSIATLSAGSHSITAVFSANPNFNGSTSPALTQQINPGLATHFLVTAATGTPTAGTAFNVTVTAEDQFNNTATGYSGTVQLASSDGQFVPPANSTLTNGVGIFSVTLKTAGSQTVTATDTVTSSITGTSTAVTVSPVAATHFAVSAPPGIVAGTTFDITVTALDPYNNTASAYAGTVQFSSTATAATLPPNTTLSQGVGTFPVILYTAGNQTVTATDTVTSSITGSSGTVVVNPTADPTFTVTALAPVVAGTPVSFTVTAHDEYSNTDRRYSGTVHFSSSDPSAVLPANTTLSNGTGTFNATFQTTGTPTLTATDTSIDTITGSTPVIVSAGAAFQLVFATPPRNTAAGAAVNPAVSVRIEDSLGNVVTSDNTDQVTLGIASGPGSFTASSTTTVTVVNGIATFSNLVFTTAGTYTLSETATGGLSGPASSAFNVTFVVTSFTPTATGFVVTFSQPFNDATSPTPQINLYNASSINAGPADVTIVSNTTGKAITGSLLIDPSNSKITFLKTTLDGTNGAPLANSWGLLPAGSYTVTLVSGAQAFETTGGLLLDGAGNGVAGSNYTTTFTVSPPASNAVIVTVPDFARGPDATDTINVPNNASPAVGIPIDLNVLAPTQTIAFASGVTGGSFRLSFNGSPTGAITWSSNTTTLATNIKNALGALANVGGSGNVSVSVTGTTQLTATVTFAATVANPNLMTVSLNSLSPSGATITISNPNAPASVTSATFTLDYNANLLTISGGTVNATLGGTNSFTVTTSGSGTNAQATITFTSSAGLALGTLGTVLLGGLTAIVPTNAPYKSKALLHFDLTSSPPSVNGGTVPVVSSDGLQVVDFFGDTNGDGFYTSADAANISRVAGKADTGFGTFPVVDPAIIANLSDTGLVNSGDAVTLNAYLNGGSPAQLPPYPGAPSNNPSGPDPTLSLPTDVAVGADGTVTVPVNIDDARPAGSNGLTEATLALTYDPSVLSVTAADVQLGSVPQAGSGWKVQAAVDQATGQLGITLFSATPLASAEGGNLVTIAFHVINPALLGTTAVDLVSSVNPTGHLLIATALDDAQGPLTLPAVPAAADGVVSAGSVLLGATPLPAAASGSVQDPAALPPAGAAAEAPPVEGSVVLAEAATASTTVAARVEAALPAVAAAAAGVAVETDSGAAAAAAGSGVGLAAAMAASQQTVVQELTAVGAGPAPAMVPAAALAVHGAPLAGVTTEAPALPASVGNVLAAPTGHAAAAAPSPTTVAAAGPGLVFQFGNGAFLNTAAPANSPPQQLTDRVFRSLGQDRADAFARSVVAALLPAERPQDVFDGLFGAGGVAALDWLSGVDVSAAVDDGWGDSAVSALVPQATVAQGDLDRAALDDCFAGMADGTDQGTGEEGD